MKIAIKARHIICMPRFSVGLAIIACWLVVPCQTAGAQEKSSWWNPLSAFKKSDDKAIESSFFNKKPKSSFSMPKFSLASSQKKVNSNSKSTMSQFGKTSRKIGTSTKKMWNSTVDFLNPFDEKPEKKSRSGMGYQPQIKEKKSGSGPFGWMWQEQKTETPATMNEWMKQTNPLLAR